MTTLEDEAKIEREQGKLARNMITCLRSLYVNSVKEILPFSQKIFGQPGNADMRVIVKKLKKIQIYQELTADIFRSESSSISRKINSFIQSFTKKFEILK